MKENPRYLLVILLAFCFILTSCGDKEDIKTTPAGPSDAITAPGNRTTLKIISGSENRELAPILQKFSEEKKINLEMVYAGSLDIMRELEKDTTPYNAVWPASSLWISLGDKNHRVKHLKTTSITPVIFGIKKSLAQSLGFMRDDVKMADILEAIKSGKLKFSMTSATQSNSGASAYLSFLSALSGSPDVLTMENLENPDVQEGIKSLLSGIDRSSGSSEWLKTLFLQGDFDAMVNYESLIITTDQELVKAGKEPLYAVYPVDGLAISDSPLGYVSGTKEDEESEKAFLELQNYLSDPTVQSEIQKTGRRTGYEGVSEENKSVFNPEWGFKPDRILSPIKTPQAEVIFRALELYQTQFRKPSLNIYCLDYSGSMSGEGNRQLEEAMKELLIQENAKKNLLQASAGEENVIIFFDDNIMKIVKASGNGAETENLYREVESMSPEGGTDIYGAAVKALETGAGYDLSKYTPAVILMTDGRHNGGGNMQKLKNFYNSMVVKIPVFSIMFGDADEKELTEISKLTGGRVFDGRRDLIDAFRKVKGYN